MSSSSSESSSFAPKRKRKQDAVESSDSSDDDLDSDTSNVPPHPPTTELTVLSHAERRRQKKRQQRDQLAATSESQSPRKKRKLYDGVVAPSPSDVHTKAGTRKAKVTADESKHPKRQNSVWVGNLSYRTTQEALRVFFDGVGTITRIHMPMRRGDQAQSENMGFAYVDFESADAKVIAIALSEGQLDGRNLLIKDGGDFTGRPSKTNTELAEGEGGKSVQTATTDGKSLSKTAQKILRLQKQPPAPTLFLGNLGFETTEESIRQLFEAHRYWKHKDKGKGIDANVDRGGGEGGDAATSKDVWIRKIRMGTFEDSGNCKGFAFVDFTSIEHATEVLVNPRNHRLNGRDLVVEYASPDAVRRGGGGRRNPKGDQARKTKGEERMKRTPQKGSANDFMRHRPSHIEQEGSGDVEETPVLHSEPRRPDRAGDSRLHARRAKPGAALAQAQRQSAAILPSQNQKIVF